MICHQMSFTCGEVGNTWILKTSLTNTNLFKAKLRSGETPTGRQENSLNCSEVLISCFGWQWAFGNDINVSKYPFGSYFCSHLQLDVVLGGDECLTEIATREFVLRRNDTFPPFPASAPPILARLTSNKDSSYKMLVVFSL